MRFVRLWIVNYIEEYNTWYSRIPQPGIQESEPEFSFSGPT